MFFSSILQSFPLELRVKILKLVKQKTEIEYHKLRMETDPLYVLERMGLKFMSWKPFMYRGHVFTAQKIFLQPQYEDDVPYAYQVRLGILKKEELQDRSVSHYEIYLLSKETTKTYQEAFSFDRDRCHLENLIPLLNELIQNTPMEEEDYDIMYESEDHKRVLELIDQCSIKFPIKTLYEINKILRKMST